MKKTLLVFIFLSLTSVAQNKFYNYYANGLEYMEKQDWQRAITEFKSAYSLEFEDTQRKRTYGTHFIEYYPHREIGISYFMLNEMKDAKQELDLSFAYKNTDRAEGYLKKIDPKYKPPIVKEISKPVPPIQPERKQTTFETKSVVTQKIPATSSSNILVITRKYDPNGVPQVGSRLSVAVLPFEASSASAKYKEIVTEKMITELVNLRRFKVIERSAMKKIVDEQKMQASGIVDDKTAVKLGKIAGADALVVGNISLNGPSIKVSARLVDVETSETLVAQEVTIEQISPSNIDQAITNLATQVYNELPIIEGDIIKIDKEELFIDIGSIAGVRKGTKCVVFREGESIKHPISGEILGKKVSRLGEIIVIQVNDKFATVKTIESEQDIQVGDKVIIK